MKKLLLTAAASTVLASSAAMAMENEFYGTVYGGFNKLNKSKSLKSETAGNLGFGVGYYVDEMFRVDLTFDHLLDPEFKSTRRDAANNNVRVNRKADGEVNALMLNAYADLFDAGMVKFYAGLGAGVSRNELKLKETYPGVAGSSAKNYKAKKKNGLAYALHLGASTEFAPGVNGFVQYSWKDYGDTKTLVNTADKNDKFGKAKFRGHHGSLGVRVDF